MPTFNDIIFRLPASSNRLVMTQLQPSIGGGGGDDDLNKASHKRSPRVGLMQTHDSNV